MQTTGNVNSYSTSPVVTLEARGISRHLVTERRRVCPPQPAEFSSVDYEADVRA
jgi:hypothetical protein